MLHNDFDEDCRHSNRKTIWIPFSKNKKRQVILCDNCGALLEPFLVACLEKIEKLTQAHTTLDKED